MTAERREAVLPDLDGGAENPAKVFQQTRWVKVIPSRYVSETTST